MISMRKHIRHILVEPDAVARSVACPLASQPRSRDQSSRPAHSFVEKYFPSSADLIKKS